VSRRLKFVLLVLVLCAGLAAAVGAVAAVTTNTATQCATTTAASHVINVDGLPVSTVGGDALSVCATATATATNSTDTVTTTVPGPTTTVTTTVTTTAPAVQTFESVTSWARPAPASLADAQNVGWTPVPFTDKASLDAAITNLAPHQYIYFAGSSNLTISATGSANAYVIASKNPAAPTVIDFGTATSEWGATVGPHVIFAYNGTGAYDALWLHDDSNLDIYGGEFTGTGARAGINLYGATHNVVWDDFYVHDVAGAGVQETPNNGDIHDVTIRGEVARWAQNPAVDDHPDKGTGLHALLIENSGSSSHNFFNNTAAIYGHDTPAPSASLPEGAGGSVIEIGNSFAGHTLDNNTLYAKGVNLNMQPGNGVNPGSTSVQTGGNVVNLWGRTPDNGLKLGWVEGDKITGSVIHCTTDTWDTANPPVTVLHGRANTTNTYQAGVPFPTGFNIVYQDTVPAP